MVVGIQYHICYFYFLVPLTNITKHKDFMQSLQWLLTPFIITFFFKQIQPLQQNLHASAKTMESAQMDHAFVQTSG